MSKKSEILRHAEEMRKQEERRKKVEEWDERPSKLQNGMPLGCWLWVAFLVWLIYYGIKKYF
jgi:hypothetical protein